MRTNWVSCVGKCIEMCIEMCVEMSTDVCMDVCIALCMDTSVETCVCKHVCRYVTTAQNLVQISYGCSSPVLSNTKTYRTVCPVPGTWTQ